MDTENKQEKMDWRADKEQWREQRRKWRDERKQRFKEYCMHEDQRWGSGRRVWTGIFLLLIGVIALLNATVFPMPHWVFSWQMFLIAFGLFLAARHNFRGGIWFLMILVGGIFLARDYYPGIEVQKFIWPVLLICFGIFFILRPRRRRWWRDDNGNLDNDKKKDGPGGPPNPVNETTSPEDVVDSTSVFGGTKKNIVSKNFRGGDIVNVFGGSELDLTQADINGTARLELTQVFGGTKLIVPSNWQVKSDMAAIFGGVEDKRNIQNVSDPGKVLMLTGTSIFGGIEIKNY
jgi:predicted membrane protein